MHLATTMRQATTLLSISVCFGVAHATPVTGSPYFTDSQHSYVEDATSKSIGQVNMITCFMSNMKPNELVNEGNYIALVDQKICDPEQRSSSSNSGSSEGASQAADYLNAIVNATRASNSDPMLAKVWVNMDEGGQETTIFLHLSATEAPSETNPYGQFRLDFCGKGTVGGCIMNGAMQGSNGALSYYETETQGNRSHTIALKLSSVGTSTGSGRLLSSETENSVTNEIAYDFAYNQDYFLRGNECFSRDASDAETGLSVWRYGLYNAVTGERVERNSGFPIEYTANSVTYNGYLGYWGLSLPSAALDTMQSGDTVQKVDYQSQGDPIRTNYTVIKADGKLIKYTKKTSNLLALDKIKFNTFVSDASNFYTNAASNTQYEVYWDNDAGMFVVTGKMSCGQNGCETQDLDSPQQVAASFWANQNQSGIQGWSQALGGELFIDLTGVSGSVQAANVPVSYREQDLVYPDELPTTLYCVQNCPTAASLAAYFTANSVAQSPYTANTFNNWSSTQTADVVTYTGSAQNAVLVDQTANPVVLANSANYALQPQYQFGVRSGRLFTTLSDAECAPSSGTYCDHKVNAATVYYVWETGPNNWNQFAAVKDANNNFVEFDPPLQVNYTVPSGAAYGQYAGKTLVLQYGGFGDLWGIPGNCVSHITNQPVSCDTSDARYVPRFIIPFNEQTGQVTVDQTTYLVKWLEREIRFARKSTLTCTNAGLTAPTGIVLPTAADLKDPSDSNSDVYIGAKPEVTTAPRVIDGDVKY